jgi:ABC-2 type transporter
VIFVLLFRYVFGGAISVRGGSYIDYLIPGVFVQTTLFGGNATAVGLAQDLREGIIDRFRSLPMARSAVLAGRTLADLARNAVTVALMVAVGTEAPGLRNRVRQTLVTITVSGRHLVPVIRANGACVPRSCANADRGQAPPLVRDENRIIPNERLRLLVGDTNSHVGLSCAPCPVWQITGVR